MAAHGTVGVAEAAAAALVDDFDWRSFEFASAPGVPQPEALRFLLAAGLRAGVPHAAKVGVVGLAALVTSDAYDSVEGGFFAACHGRGWKDPAPAKPLSLNAAMVSALAVAASHTGRDDFERAREETRAWIDRCLSREQDDLWSEGQEADPEYYGLMAHGRSRRGAPPVLPAVDPVACARAVSAFALSGACAGDRATVGRGRLALQALLGRGAHAAGQDADGTNGRPREGAGDPRVRLAMADAVMDVLCVSRDVSLEPDLLALLAAARGDGNTAATADPDRAVVLLRADARGATGAVHDPAPPTPPLGPRAWAAHGWAGLAAVHGVIRIEGAAGSALCTGAVATCAPYGPVVVHDAGSSQADENRVVVSARRLPPREARRRSELAGLAAHLAAPGAPAMPGGAPR